ncbi:hypothetical protein M0P48_00890 [Candidatus Gracilibacteria bacterium]|nr:hypothetical protein [Candidatus Gracilibacteria bacterium]
MFESITKSLGLDSIAKQMHEGFFANIMPSLQKAYEVAKENKDGSFVDKAKLFLTSFNQEMERLKAEKGKTTEETQQKTQQTLARTQEQLNSTLENLGTASKRAFSTAMEVANDTYNKGLSGATCCFDWVSKIYAKAGVKRKEVFSTLNKYRGQNCGDAHAGEGEYSSLAPGDHIFYNLQKNYDAKYEEKMQLYKEGKLKEKPERREAVDSQGNHSAIFIGWIDEGNKIAQLASGSYGTNWGMHKNPIDFNKTPITRIFKPVVA